MIRRSLIAVVLAALATPQVLAVETAEINSESAVADPAAAVAKAPWSEVVDGLQARITLQHTRIFNGTPILRPYLELRNTTDVATPLKLPFSTDQLKFKVVDATGKERATDGLSYSGGGGFRADLVIPFQGELSFAIAYSGCGVSADKAGLIDLGPFRCYLFQPDEGKLYLHTSLDIPDERPASERAWHGRIELPLVLIPMKVKQPDPGKIAALINELGARMVKRPSTTESSAAEHSLSMIADDRVIPWYVKAMETDSYELRFAALDRLSRFGGDEAFGALKQGITPDDRDVSNDNIRHAAAGALARSPHPDAKRLLISKWEDPSSAVRITILHELGKMRTNDSRALLKKLSEDSDEEVRNEARRYLKMRTDAAQTPEDKHQEN